MCMQEYAGCPLVSVVMPAYNAERFIAQAVESVLNQTMPSLELIVVDDCSQDQTVRIVKDMQERDPRIRLVRNDSNLGPGRSRNLGMGLCAGQYIAFLDSDDLWRPHKLRRQVDLAVATGAEIVYCSYGIIDGVGNKLCADFLVPEQTSLEGMLTQNVISCSTGLITARVGRKYHFSPEYYHEDYAFWLRLLQDSIWACGLTEVLADYRVLPHSRASGKIRNARERWRIYRNFLTLPVRRAMDLSLKYAASGFKKYRRQRGGAKYETR